MTTVGPVTLTVADLARATAFYTERLGFRVHDTRPGVARLGAGGGDMLVLEERPGARTAPRSTGLFHFAVLLPSREALGSALARLVESRTPLQGASDHAVSEALYLADPEGNGIELYRDRPREEWPWEDGAIRMTTDPLDVQLLLEEGRAAAPWRGLPDATAMGHIHLRVAHIPPAERFYCDLLGFDLMARYGTRASFVSIGGYHHNVAFNTWGGVGAPPPPEGAAGLKEFVLRHPDADLLESALTRLRSAGLPVADGNLVDDPSGNRVRLVAG